MLEIVQRILWAIPLTWSLIPLMKEVRMAVDLSCATFVAVPERIDIEI